jgi:SAM-dependent methyltransferase
MKRWVKEIKRQQKMYKWDRAKYKRDTEPTLLSKTPSRYFSTLRLISQFITSNHLMILDVGCSDGYYLDYVQRYSKQVKPYGVDIFFDSLLCAKALGINTVCAAGEFLPFKDETFDAIFCFEVIEHSAKPSLLLKSIKRVLKPRGIILLSTPLQSHLGRVEQRIVDKLRSCTNKASERKFHFKEYSKKEMMRIFNEVGLDVIHSELSFNKGIRLISLYMPFGRQILSLLTKLLLNQYWHLQQFYVLRKIMRSGKKCVL